MRINNKKGAIEAFNFVFFLFISVLLIIIFIIAINNIKQPERVIEETKEISDSKFFMHALLKSELSYQSSTLTIQEAILLYSEQEDINLKNKLISEINRVLVVLYGEDLCWEMNFENDDDFVELDNSEIRQSMFCIHKKMNVDFLAPSKKGSLKYNLRVLT